MTIENYILIEHLELTFNDAMSVFTGETGAGKSIFINALNLLCGSRLNSDVVGNKGDETKIEGIFVFKKGSHAYKTALAYDFNPDEEFVFSRIITKQGRSNYKINRQNVNLTIVKDILQDEIDIHSQFDTTYLRDEKLHLGLLDRYHHRQDLLDNVKDAYLAIREIEKEKAEFEKTLLNDIEKDFLKFQIQEIENLNLSLKEEQEISEELKEMSHFEENHTHFRESKSLLSKTDETHIYQAIESLKQVKSNDSEVSELIEMLESAYYQLEEVTLSLNKLIDKDIFDPYEFERLQSRSFEYNKIKRKYQMDTEQLLEYYDNSLKKIDETENQTYMLSKYNLAIEEKTKEFRVIAKELSSVREQAANNLKVEIEKQLFDLSLPYAQFEVEFFDKESSKGLEDCRFLISVNKGQPLASLSKVASGGELSRFMLGMKVIFNRLQQIECVVFDEIDTGISGPVALQVGLKMKELAQECAVITVTHLPAVAACGDSHYVVSKTSDETKTLVNIHQLDDQKRIEELAQMAFTNTNQSSLNAAQELLIQAREAINNG